ncbi:MAG TPA: ATPase, T2SS/T4P/T4SS family, partial [Desulfosarcina sp.]|nr:ATPase, T2SS/T4P/T4SS family [Desulfosarcina sp.]
MSTQTDYGKIIGLLIELGQLTQEQIRYALRVRSKIKTEKPLLEIIKELGYIDEEQIRRTLRENALSMRIGDFLVELGLIGPQDLELALRLQNEESPRRKLGEVLVAHNLIEERKLISVLSIQLGFPYIEPDFLKIDPELFKRGSVVQYQEHHFVPVRKQEGKVLVAFADPMDQRDVDAATKAMHMPVIPAIATKPSIKAAIDHWRTDKKATEYISSETGESVVDIVNAMIIDAIDAADVSDIHIDPLADRLRIRFRLDGVLVQHRDYPMSIAQALSTRIKVLCNADIAEKRRHQGGRILFDHDGHQMDIRVSFFATVKGEKIVLRLLNRQTELLDINQIG